MLLNLPLKQLVRSALPRGVSRAKPRSLYVIPLGLSSMEYCTSLTDVNFGPISA
ncbi:MAG: hypothetical protein IIT83_10130 [Bacteroidales bacterium]|nr:hypothetical protein [Bacteroidales bacterium]